MKSDCFQKGDHSSVQIIAAKQLRHIRKAFLVFLCHMLNKRREYDSQCFPMRQMYDTTDNLRERMRCACTGVCQCTSCQGISKTHACTEIQILRIVQYPWQIFNHQTHSLHGIHCAVRRSVGIDIALKRMGKCIKAGGSTHALWQCQHQLRVQNCLLREVIRMKECDFLFSSGDNRCLRYLRTRS